ncbi:MAG TPA: TlyA family RNA methyltransferase [Promineifilum sp.]|nr:TlyA family RNA methyltransferase [Promineifilum sp.]HRO89489.1 TlyA family RNA methyltransferase [Promineifilum sp.]HRQ12252.1 TlyA family RNA methyltransferase [Promineifilum sp.]
MAKDKERLDVLLVERGLVETRARARAHIMAGEVTVDGVRVDKAGTQISRSVQIELAAPMPYASRGGYKLAGALEQFGLDVADRVAADIGACTGGFTDVLLQRGAARVYAIDVGQGQLVWKLRQDERVVVMERTNARYLDSLLEPVSLVVIDVSFISLKLILPAVRKWLSADADVVALIKPQFEAGPESVGKGGIVRDAAVRRAVLEDLLGWANEQDWSVNGLIQSPIQGTDGNIEYLAWLRSTQQEGSDIAILIDSVLS